MRTGQDKISYLFGLRIYIEYKFMMVAVTKFVDPKQNLIRDIICYINQASTLSTGPLALQVFLTAGPVRATNFWILVARRATKYLHSGHQIP